MGPDSTSRNGLEDARMSDDLAGRLVWIFGSPRSGSTWLAQLLTRLTGGVQINEPLIGAHLGLSIGNLLGTPVDGDPLLVSQMASRSSYFFSDDSRDTWQPLLRALLLGRFAPAVAGRPGLVIVKEPWGSTGAQVLMRALPESRLLFLVRDGRDVVDSLVDGADGGWITDTLGARVDDRSRTILEASLMWARSIEETQRAFDLHPAALRLQLSYENLLTDTTAELQRIAAWLEIGRDEVRPIVEQSQLSVRGRTSGRKRFFRSAHPGLWRDHLTTDEQEIAQRVMGPTLAKFGYE
jgi:hypothetical protein